MAFRADAAFAKPEIYDALETRDADYAIRMPANSGAPVRRTSARTEVTASRAGPAAARSVCWVVWTARRQDRGRRALSPEAGADSASDSGAWGRGKKV